MVNTPLCGGRGSRRGGRLSKIYADIVYFLARCFIFVICCFLFLDGEISPSFIGDWTAVPFLHAVRFILGQEILLDFQEIGVEK